MKLQQAKEQNDKLDAENRALRDRVRILESEKKNLLDQVSIYGTYLLIYYNKMNKISYDRSLALTGVVFFFHLAKNDAAKEDRKDKSVCSDQQNNLSALSAQEKDHIHKR